MFNVRYDLTKGQLRRRSSKRLAGAIGSLHRGVRRADICNVVPSGGAGGANTGAGFGPAGMGVDQRYSPVFDRAEVPNLGQQFLPADTQSQNKIFRQIVTFDPIVGSALEHWRDLTFSDGVILGGIKDEKVLQFYNDAIETSGIVSKLPDLLFGFLSMGRFVFHMTMNESLGYWDRIIPHDLDYLSVQAAPMVDTDPLIDLMPTDEQKKWALSKDPRVIEQHRSYDPVLIKFMAAGKKIPLAPENTMFLARTLFPWDRMGMSMLTRVLLFVVYEAAIFNASVAGARRRAGPLWHITAWEDAADNELTDLLNMFMAAEEDPVGAKVVTKSGVTVNPVGGGSGDYWKLSEEWPFLLEGKMHALGTSASFLSGEANWNSMETVRTVFLEKIGAMRSFFTKRIILDKMLSQLALMNDYTERTAAELSHRIRIGRPHTVDDPRLLLPTIEWSRPLTPTKDQEYLDILSTVKGFGLPPNLRAVAQAAGVDLEKELDNLPADLEIRKRIYSYQRALAKIQQSMGINPDGSVDLGAGDAGEDMDLGGGDEFGMDMGGGGGGGGEEAGGGGFDLGPATEAPTAPTEPGGGAGGGGGAAPPTPATDTGPAGGGGAGGGGGEAGPGGAGASTLRPRFELSPPSTGTQRYAGTQRDLLASLQQLPLWDANGSLLGIPMRKAAEVLDRISRSDPSRTARTRLAETLYRRLRKEGFDELQVETLEYLAMRLGYVPKLSLREETYEVLSRLALSKMNGHGLTGDITQELIAISRIKGERVQHEPQLPRSGWPARNPLEYLQTVFRGEKALSHNRILTGRIDPKRDLMPPKGRRPR